MNSAFERGLQSQAPENGSRSWRPFRSTCSSMTTLSPLKVSYRCPRGPDTNECPCAMPFGPVRRSTKLCYRAAEPSCVYVSTLYAWMSHLGGWFHPWRGFHEGASHPHYRTPFRRCCWFGICDHVIT